jgi:hypothetical protein
VTVVKGSKQSRLKVVEDRPLFIWGTRLLLLLAVVALVGGAHRYGISQGRQGQIVAEEELLRLRQELAETRAFETDLRQQLANLRLGSQVDRQASEDVRQEVIELKNQLAELQEENSFYRNLMAPADNKEGLNFGAVEVSDTDVPRQYRYKVVLQQLATSHQLLSGTLTFNVVGRRDDIVTVLPLKDISEDIDSVNIKLRFKYFQTVEGLLQLPPGFEPERIELVARSTGRNAVTVEKRFGWLVEET